MAGRCGRAVSKYSRNLDGLSDAGRILVAISDEVAGAYASREDGKHHLPRHFGGYRKKSFA